VPTHISGMKTRTGQTRATGTAARLLFATTLGTLALLAAGAGTAAAAPAATQQATSRCWLAVVNDWLDNNRVDGTYNTACYTQAIQHLASYPDIQQYSSAMDDIHRALLAAIHNDRGNGPGSTGGSNSSSSGPGGAAPTGGGGNGGGKGNGSGTPDTSSSAAAPTNDSFITRLFDAAKPGDAQAIPLPLLVLAGLAVLLLLAAGGTWLAKRLQARRMTPATAPAPVDDKRR
jgi:hypothetical protein